MIELEKSGQFPQLQSKRELRDALEGYIGRLIRLSYYNGSPAGSSVTLTQRTVRLQEVQLKAVYSSRVYSDRDSSLSLLFFSGESEQIAPGTDSVEVFQEDTGSWQFIHRSQSFTNLVEGGYEL